MSEFKSLIPKKNSPDKDRVYTPTDLANKLCRYFIPPCVTVLEPCRGSKSFYNALFNCAGVTVDWCEIDEGRDFFDYKGRVDYIVTNPPFSLMRKFLNKSMEVADNIVFLCPINHILGLKARVRDIKEKGFYVREILHVDTPKEFPSSGFAYAAILLNKNSGDCKISKLEDLEIYKILS